VKTDTADDHAEGPVVLGLDVTGQTLFWTDLPCGTADFLRQETRVGGLLAYSASAD
jgi:hypothetical protein